MSAYVVVQIEVHDPETYERYKAISSQAAEAYGGRFLVRGGAKEVLEGSWNPSRFVILEFPSAARAREWWSSPEYEEGKRLRQLSAATEMLLVEGV